MANEQYLHWAWLVWGHVTNYMMTDKPKQEDVHLTPELRCVFVCFLGYAFLLFQEESSVQALIEACMEEDGKLYLCVSSPTIKDKPVSSTPPTKSDIVLSLKVFPINKNSYILVSLWLQVQIRPWNLSDSDFVMDGSQPLDPRKTIFVGGVPRPLRAS